MKSTSWAIALSSLLLVAACGGKVDTADGRHVLSLERAGLGLCDKWESCAPMASVELACNPPEFPAWVAPNDAGCVEYYCCPPAALH